MTVDSGSMRESVPSSQPTPKPRGNPLDADRIPGYGQSGGRLLLLCCITRSLVGPNAFERRGFFGDDGEPVSPSCIPPGARFDPFAPSGLFPSNAQLQLPRGLVSLQGFLGRSLLHAQTSRRCLDRIQITFAFLTITICTSTPVYRRLLCFVCCNSLPSK